MKAYHVFLTACALACATTSFGQTESHQQPLDKKTASKRTNQSESQQVQQRGTPSPQLQRAQAEAERQATLQKCAEMLALEVAMTIKELSTLDPKEADWKVKVRQIIDHHQSTRDSRALYAFYLDQERIHESANRAR